ncbi:MAG: hypothetical protein KH813_05165 [Negativicoccus succinicivorans]|uniref:hypothetical protein n=1 Tax=Negativicoccus succinicivorans TaxID=620903 RepID=UPI0026EF67C2|nr:hypothetical protein [Negativicoccus succinicivorans]MBS6028790.1 hypothetical protein [Negativicoccus succinicivorans]
MKKHRLQKFLIAACVLSLPCLVAAQADVTTMPVTSPGTDSAAGAARQEMGPDGNQKMLVWSVAEIQNEPLAAQDFSVGGLRLGDDPERLTGVLGAPLTIMRGNRIDRYHFKEAEATVQQSLPYDQKTAATIDVEPIRTLTGISALTVTKEKLMTSRGIGIGNSRENVIRVYGTPSLVEYDPSTKISYYRYRLHDNEITYELTFAIHELQVKSMQLTYVSALKEKRDLSFTANTPASLLGFVPGTMYREPSWSEWETHLTQGEIEIWMHGDFGVTVESKTQKIKRVFLRNTNVATDKGVAIGDSLSTVTHVYGEPNAIVHVGDQQQTALLYYPQNLAKRLYLVFVLDTQKDQLTDIILTQGRINEAATPEERYGFTRKSQDKSDAQV